MLCSFSWDILPSKSFQRRVVASCCPWWGQPTGSHVRIQTDLPLRLFQISNRLPLSVYTVAKTAFFRHHITFTTTNWSKCNQEKVALLHCDLASRTKTILQNLHVTTDEMWNVVLCYLLWCRTSLCGSLSFTLFFYPSKSLASSCFSVFRIHCPHPFNPPSADGVLIGAAMALLFSRERERESHIWKLSGRGSAHSALSKASQSRTSDEIGRGSKKARELKTKKGSAAL